jgi:hypothetical protein
MTSKDLTSYARALLGETNVDVVACHRIPKSLEGLKAMIAFHLAPDGSYFLSGKPHRDLVYQWRPGDGKAKVIELEKVSVADMVFEGHGSLLFLDSIDGRVGRCDLGTGQIIAQSKAIIKQPLCLALTKERIYVTDYRGRQVQVFDHGLKLLGGFGASNLCQPSAITAFGDERLVVCDELLNRVFVFDSLGTVIHRFGQTGSGAMSFNTPKSIAIANNIVYVADTYNDRIKAHTLDGKFIYQLENIGGVSLKRPTHLVVSRDQLHVCLGHTLLVCVLTLNGRLSNGRRKTLF